MQPYLGWRTKRDGRYGCPINKTLIYCRKFFIHMDEQLNEKPSEQPVEQSTKKYSGIKLVVLVVAAVVILYGAYLVFTQTELFGGLTKESPQKALVSHFKEFDVAVNRGDYSGSLEIYDNFIASDVYNALSEDHKAMAAFSVVSARFKQERSEEDMAKGVADLKAIVVRDLEVIQRQRKIRGWSENLANNSCYYEYSGRLFEKEFWRYILGITAQAQSLYIRKRMSSQ